MHVYIYICIYILRYICMGCCICMCVWFKFLFPHAFLFTLWVWYSLPSLTYCSTFFKYQCIFVIPLFVIPFQISFNPNQLKCFVHLTAYFLSPDRKNYIICKRNSHLSTKWSPIWGAILEPTVPYFRDVRGVLWGP